MGIWKQNHRNTVALTKVGVTVVRGLFLFSFIFLFFPVSVLAVPVPPAPFINTSPGQGDLVQVINSILQVILVLIGFAATAMLVYGGLKYLMAGADKEAAAAARNTLTYAIIGFILAVSIWAIFNLLGSFLGINLRAFNLSFP